MSKTARLKPILSLYTPDRLAVVISLLGVLASFLVTERVFEEMPHIEDEVAYVWQARVITHGQMTISTPPHPISYLVPFVVDLHGQRFGKYPPGWPALLAIAVKLGVRSWMNPLLAGLGVWLTYLLGKRIFGKVVGLLAAGLTVTSPFFLMNSGSLLSHPFGLVLSAVFALSWFGLFDGGTGGKGKGEGVYLFLAGLTLGVLILTRPFTAAAVAVPFGLHGLYLLVRGAGPFRAGPIRAGPIRAGAMRAGAGSPTDRSMARGPFGRGRVKITRDPAPTADGQTRPVQAVGERPNTGGSAPSLHGRMPSAPTPPGRGRVKITRDPAPTSSSPAPYRRRVLAVGLMALAFVGLYLVWQKTVTGNALTNPYVLWWPYDKIGFGKGYGILPQGHNLPQALYNTRLSLTSGAFDLFGWGALSWIFIPFGMWAVAFRGSRGDHGPIGLYGPSGLHGTHRRQAWMLFGMAACLVIFYMAYWIGSELFGPRYYYESLFSLTLFSGVGIAFLAGWPIGDTDHRSGDEDHQAVETGATHLQVKAVADRPITCGAAHLCNKGRQGGVTPPLRWWRGVAVMLLVAGLVGYNLAVYLPERLGGMHGLYGISRDVIKGFLNAHVLPADGGEMSDVATIQPALIIVHSNTWHFYGALLELEDPFMTTPYVFAWNEESLDRYLPEDFPGRRVFHYYQEDPGVLYTRPKP